MHGPKRLEGVGETLDKVPPKGSTTALDRHASEAVVKVTSF